MTETTYSKYSFVKIFTVPRKEISKIDFALCQQPRETPDSYYKRQTVKPDLISNGGFFGMSTGDTCFTYVDEGKTIAYNANTLEGIGIINGQLAFGTYSTSYTDFICGYPVLIRDSQPVSTTLASEINYNARRTIFAYDDTNIYLIAVESPGLAFTAMKNMLMDMKVKYAINLDGGGSTRVLKNGVLRTSSSIANRPVDNVVAIYLKKDTTTTTNTTTSSTTATTNTSTKTIYRVQVGAYGTKAGAETMQKKVQALTDSIGAGYKNAFVVYVKPYYKVQVGAFSSIANANKVVKDLKSKGFNSFVTKAV